MAANPARVRFSLSDLRDECRCLPVALQVAGWYGLADRPARC